MSRYSGLAADREPKTLRDWTAKWNTLAEVAAVNGVTAERIEHFCERKGITLDALTALGARVATRRQRTCLAFAGWNRDGSAVIAVKYRPIDGSSDESEAEKPSSWLMPIVVGNLASSDWIVAEGESDACRLYDLVGNHAAILVLPTGALTFKPEWADRIPRGATVYLAHDADESGDKGARKAAQVLGRAVRLRPPETDWCDWRGTHEEFVELVSEAKNDESASSADGPIFLDLRDIEARDVGWVDKPFLPAGELVTNNADGDTGKGLLAAHWGARISRGEFGDPRMVFFAVAEDAFDTILKPRLMAQGANFDYIRALSWRRAGTEDALLIPDDIPLLSEHIVAMAVRLLVIDPLLSHMSGKVNTHTDHEVKRALQPLMALAHSTNCTVLGNGHFSKDKAGGARRAASGSTAFTNTPRVGLAMAYDDEEADVRVLEVIKSNVGPKGIGRNYRVKALAVPGLSEPVPALVAEGAATKSVDDLIAAEKVEGKRIPSELVRELILAEVKTGEKVRTYLDAIALEKLGANADTVYKSGLAPLQKAGEIKARKDGLNGPWCYRVALEEWAE